MTIVINGRVRPVTDAKEEVHQSVFRVCHTARTRPPLPHSLYMASGGVLLLCRVVTACKLRDFRILILLTYLDIKTMKIEVMKDCDSQHRG